MIKEAKRLYGLGLAIQWLQPNSKKPLKELGWQKGPRKKWAELEDTYRYGMNMGVRLGMASRFKDGTYLCVIDCDVKSEHPSHLKEMEKKLLSLLGAKSTSAPTVSSGRGNGSRHIYVRTRTPVSPFRFSQSSEKVRVSMPSEPRVSRSEKAELKEHEIRAGIRIRAAWEISVMGEGQQVVLPPSIHPDTGDTYEWATPLVSFKKMPKLEFERPEGTRPAHLDDDGKHAPFVPEEVDFFDGHRLPNHVVDLILSGDNCNDRSAALFTVSIQMVKAGYTDNQILSVLTDQGTYLGVAAYEHANTSSRKRAAEWVRKYTLLKARQEVKEENHFEGAVAIEDIKIEKEYSERGQKKSDWHPKIDRQGDKEHGPPKPTLKNITTILSGDIADNLFKFDEFAFRTSYGVDAPWGAKAGDVFRDNDAPKIKHWLSEHHRFEPSVQTIWEAMFVMAERNAFHPIKQYLEGLPAWDCVPRIHGFLKRVFHAQGPDFYLDEVFEKYLVGAVTRIYEPGSKFDWMLVLEGIQNIGKSTFIEILAGSKYFIDKLPDLSDKDAAQVLQGIWLVEMGEMKELKKNEIETVKGFITRKVDKYRPSYGRATLEAPRQTLFAGSTNQAKYLKDDTGNRRFVPVALGGKLDFDTVHAERDLLWAEAFAIYRSGLAEMSEPSPEAHEYLKELHAERMVEDDSHIMEERFLDFIKEDKKKPVADRFDLRRFKLLDLFGDFGPFKEFKTTNWEVQLAAKALRRMGYECFPSSGRKFWRRPPPLSTKKQG